MQILKYYMALNELTQRQMAEKLEVSESYVSLLLRGMRWSPSLKVLKKLSELTGATLDQLVAQCGKKRPKTVKVRPLTQAEIESLAR
jgi:transcriptional regulator with XRE-family HTH domain